MKIEYTNGCCTDRITIDGEDFGDLTATKLQELKETVIDYLEERKMTEDDLQDLVLWVLRTYGISSYEYTCDDCGDSVYTTTLTI